MLAYTAIFKDAGTCRNYVGAIRWACVTFTWSLAWDTQCLVQAVNGREKRDVRLYGGTNHQRLMLTDESAYEVIHLASNLADDTWPLAASFFSWEFLFRVQGEMIPLEFGEESELEELPRGRHSAVVLVRIRWWYASAAASIGLVGRRCAGDAFVRRARR